MPADSSRLASWARITEPARTPFTWARVNDASTSPGSDWRGIRPDITDAALDSRIEHTVRRTPDGCWAWKLDMAGIAAARITADPAKAVDLWRCVGELRCPTLVIRGARSDFLSADACERMAERQRLVEWTQVAGAGHYVHDDNPVEFTRLVTAFLLGGGR